MGEYLLRTAPAADDDEQRRRRQFHLAMQLAAERIEFLHNQAINGFRNSQQEKVTLRKESVLTGKPDFDRRRTPGDPRFLMAAARLAMYAAKLPSPGLDFALLNQDLLNQDLLEEEPAETQPPTTSQTAEETTSPLKEACSAVATKAVSATEKSPPAPVATSIGEESCVAGVSVELLGKLKSAGAVQPSSESRKAEFLRSSAPHPNPLPGVPRRGNKPR